MRIAVPTYDGELCMHFGHSQEFTFVDVEGGEIKNVATSTPPPHAPGVIPKWLRDQGAEVIISSGMGTRAQDLFRQNGINVVVGAPIMEPVELAKQYINGELAQGENISDH